MSSKPKSVLRTQLSDLQQAQLAEWLMGGMQYHQAVEVIEKQFGLTLGGGWKKQLSEFWSAVCSPQMLTRRHEAVTTAEEISSDAKSRPGQFSEATIDRLSELAFRLSINPNANPKDVKAIYTLLLKSRDQDIARERIKFDRQKFEAEFCDLLRKALTDEQTRALLERKADNSEIIAHLRQTYFADIDALEKSGAVQIPK